MQLVPNTLAANATNIPAATKFGFGYEANFNERMANQCREEYARLYTLYQAVSALHIGGIQEVTLKGPAGTVTIPLIGPKVPQREQTLYLELTELLGDRLAALEIDILRYEQDSNIEEAEEREGTGERSQVLAFCLPMRPLSDAEFTALPPEARRAYDGYRAEQVKAA